MPLLLPNQIPAAIEEIEPIALRILLVEEILDVRSAELALVLRQVRVNHAENVLARTRIRIG